jgi:hypothetical protein
MPKPTFLRPSLFTALCGLTLLGSCFSATPTRPTKNKDASADASDSPADVQIDRLPDVAAGDADGRSGGTGGNTNTSTGGTGGGTTTASATPDAGFVPDVPVAPLDATTMRDTGFVPDAPVAPVDALLKIGSPCASNGACASTFCVDGVCCDGKCEGNCETCMTGSCAFSPKPRKACAGTGKCAGACLESNTKECTFPNDKTVCAAQSCTAGVRTDKSFCDGKGGCPAQTKTNCTGGQCLADGSDCETCTDESSATTCAGGRCGPTVNNCGHTVQCPTTCSGTGQTCGGGGTAGLCGCTSAGKTETCGTSNCGTAIDNCGKQISCGTCSPGSSCVNGTCCTPACTNKCSGPDGCGGTCSATCPPGQTCGAVTPNACGCAPNCNNKCGGVSDGCNGSCNGQCGANAICQSGTCQSCGTLTACGGGCVNTSSDPTHCGNCVTVCGGETPFCVSSACGQCRNIADCIGWANCDTATHNCVCRQKSNGNKVQNPGFDVSAGLTSWDSSSTPVTAIYSTEDADGCPGSGSLYISDFAGFGQCMNDIGSNVPYKAGYRLKGQAYCGLAFYSARNCTGFVGEDNLGGTWGSSGWMTVGPFYGTTPADTQSAHFGCSGAASVGNFDQIYFNIGGETF